MPDLKNIICLFLIAGFHSAAQAQELEFEPLTIEQGLPSSEVYNLYEDKKGYIWACTEYGLVKHNGTRFNPVCKNIPFEESAFYVIKESAKGDLYLVNSNANIYTVRNDSAILLKGLEKISEKIVANKEVIFDVLIDNNDNIYFSTLNTSYFFSDDKVVSLSDQYENDSGNIYFKKVGEDYALIKTESTINKHPFFNVIKVIDEQNKLICQVPYIFYYQDRNRIRKFNQSFYFINKNKLILRSNRGYTKTFASKGTIMNLEISPDSTIWIGTSNGLYQLDTNLNTLTHYFEGSVVSDILFDHRNGMWVSTIEKGVYYCRNRNNIYYHDIKELSSKISLLKNVNNKFLIGTSDGNVFEKKNNRLIKLNRGNNIASITDIAYFNNTYIVGTKYKALVMDDNLNLVKSDFLFQASDENMAISSYGFAYENNALIFISPKGVFRYRNDGVNVLALCTDRPRCVAARKDKEYIIGTTNGIYLLKDTMFYRPDFMMPLRNKIILSLLVDKGQSVWIGTKGYGLYKLLSDNKLTGVKNIPSNVVNNINIIHDTIILLSTDKGLFINNLNTINRNSSWKILVNNEVTGVEAFDDQLYVATKQGLISLNKNKALTFTTPAPRFYLESIIINNRAIGFDNIELLHNENNIYFNFDILAYETPGYTISYELEGPESINGVTTGNQIYLHKLQPGYYTLSAKPFYSGIYNQHALIKIPFYIRPAFWQTKAFLITTAFSLIAVIFFILQNLKQKEKRKVRIARQLAEYRLTALKAQINPHFISNSLTAIQQLMIRNEPDKASQYLAKFSLLLRYVLKYSDKYVTSLADEINLIGINVELEQLRFNNKFTFEKDICANISLDEIFVPPLITQPIVENAIWHGLLPLNGERDPKLILKVNVIDEKLIISIVDNGVGRKNVPANSGYMDNKESRGTWLIWNWIENLNQLTAVKGTVVNYIDLIDEQHNPAGTKVDIVFPVEALNRLHNEKNTIRNY